MTHADRPKSTDASPNRRPGPPSDSSTSTAPQLCKATPSMSGRTANGWPASTGAEPTKRADHHPDRRGKPPSRPSRYAAPIVATRPSAEISRPASRAASTGCSPARAIGQAKSAAQR